VEGDEMKLYFKGIKGIIKLMKRRFKNPLFPTIITLTITNVTLIIISLNLSVNFEGINLLQKVNELDLIRNIGINIINLLIPVVNILSVFLLKFSFYISHICIISIVGIIEVQKEKSIYKKFIDMKFVDPTQRLPKILNFDNDKNSMEILIKSTMTKVEIESYSDKFNHFFDKKLYKINSLGNQKVKIILLSNEEYNKLNKKEYIDFKNKKLSFEERLKGTFEYLNLNISNIQIEENYLFKNIYFNSNEKYTHLKAMEIEIVHRLQKIINIDSSDVDLFDYKITLRKNKALSFKETLKNVIPQMDKMDIPFLLGADTRGKIKVVDYRTKYHTIVGGTTGSGKTNYIHSVLCGLLYANKNITYTILDIKKDMNMYKGIDNVVYSDDTQTIKSILENLVLEMEYRNELTSQLGFTKDIEKYNKHVENPLPYIIVVIDELADLLMSYGTKESEDIQKLIQRLVQRSRSAGFRILLTTQKPTIKVINGIIKGNCSNRMGFMVDNGVDSRIILDDSRASTITGIGEFYFKSDNKFTLYKGVFISDEEHENILNHVKENFKIA
jgi:hypothetical protein